MKRFAEPRTEQPESRVNSSSRGAAAETSVEAPGVARFVRGPPTEMTVPTKEHRWHGREYGSQGASSLCLVPVSAFLCRSTEGAERIRRGWERPSGVWERTRIAASEHRAARSLFHALKGASQRREQARRATRGCRKSVNELAALGSASRRRDRIPSVDESLPDISQRGV